MPTKPSNWVWLTVVSSRPVPSHEMSVVASPPLRNGTVPLTWASMSEGELE